MVKERQYVEYEMEDRIAVVTINRPPVNALNPQVEGEIKELFEELGNLEGVGAVIVTGGGGKAFMAGADIKMIRDVEQEDAYALSRTTQSVLNVVEQFERVVIAAVNGLALGGGCEVALACDIRVADESAVFGFPEVGLGLLPGAGGTQRLARLVGIGKAKELILTGDPVDALEAKSFGLVERVAPKGESLKEAKKVAERILLRGPLAVAMAKRAINQGINMTLEEGLKVEARLFSGLFETQDKKEGVAAFIEKRKPRFTGR
jgi:enoyl-CoA hydratase